MAIAFDTAAESSSGAAASLTYSHTCTGSNLILFAYARVASNAASIVGVTYSGVAMTAVGSQISGDGNDSTSLWRLINPATGANNVVISSSSSVAGLGGISTSYSGVAQAGFPDAGPSTFGPNLTNPQTLTITSSADNAWMIAACRNGAGGATMTNGTNRSPGPNQAFFLADNGPQTPAGNVTVSYSWTPAFYGYMTGVTIAPAGAAAVTSKNLPLLGIGT